MEKIIWFDKKKIWITIVTRISPKTSRRFENKNRKRKKCG
jgi:hypothetical protein